MNLLSLFIGGLSAIYVPVTPKDSIPVREHSLDQVSVTASIQGTELRKIGRNVTVITAKQIEDAPVKSLDGILQYALNIDVRSRSPLGGQADISIRGGHYDQTLILVDGIKMNDPQTGHHSLNLPVPFSLIERIEVLQGGASRVFGPSAFSGVIHIITKKDKPTGLDLGLAGGQFGLQQMTGTAHVQTSKVGATLAAERMKHDGYRPQTAFNRQSILGQSTWYGQGHTLTVQGGWMGNDFEAANFYHPKFNQQYEEVSSTYAVGKWLWDISSNTSSTVSVMWREHRDMYDFDRYRFTNPSGVNHHQTDVWEAEWRGKWRQNKGSTAWGASFRREEVLSNRLGVERTPIPIPGEYVVQFTRGKQRDNSGFFLEQNQQLGQWNLSAGTLLNYNTQFGWAFYPGLDLTFLGWNDQQIYFSANRSLRLPTFTELYLNTSTVRADPNLKPESATSFEVGWKGQLKGIRWITSLFYRNTQDAIDKVKRPELTVPTMENIQHINMAGWEVSLTKKWPNWPGQPTLSILYAYLVADRREEGFQSFYTLNYLRNKASIGINTRIGKLLTLDVWYTWKDRMGNYQWDATSPLLRYPDVHLVDLRWQYARKKSRYFVDVNNALNQIYQEHGFVMQPGRWVSLGGQWSW